MKAVLPCATYKTQSLAFINHRKRLKRDLSMTHRCCYALKSQNHRQGLLTKNGPLRTVCNPVEMITLFEFSKQLLGKFLTLSPALYRYLSINTTPTPHSYIHTQTIRFFEFRSTATPFSHTYITLASPCHLLARFTAGKNEARFGYIPACLPCLQLLFL